MMSISNSIYMVLFPLSILSLNFIYCLQSNTFLCPEIEKQSLISLKQSLNSPNDLLLSWKGEVDCCKWRGVVCSNSTRHVLELHLQESGLSGKLNPSLLNLKHLTYFDISYNYFDGETIPSFIGSFTELEYLDLSFAGFEGKIPNNIGNLSNLYSLHLPSDWPILSVDSLEWLSGLSKLEYLNMNRVNLSRATNWVKVINSIPSLLELYLHGCNLDFTSPLDVVNLTSLTHIDLSLNRPWDNPLSIPFPPWFFQLKNLIYLDLSEMGFVGPLPTVSNATKLQHIDLSYSDLNSSIPDWLYLCKDLDFVSFGSNYFRGEISDAVRNLTSLEILRMSSNNLRKLPRGIANLCKLRELDFSFNDLHGDAHDSFGNMSRCFLGSLELLYLEGNQLSGHLTEQFGEFKSLAYLDLSNNSLSGALPISLGNTSTLEFLFLQDNNFTGKLPEGLGHLSKLKFFYIDDNKLQGVVTETHFANLSKLTVFFASGNHLTLNVCSNWVPPIKLQTLALGSWKLGAGSKLPSWLRTQRNITILDISNTGISDIIPHWFFNLHFLNASQNNFHGIIPLVIRYKENSVGLDLSSNELRGSLPRIVGDIWHFDVSQNLFSKGLSHLLCHSTNKTLEYLNLEGNMLTGELPDCWDKLPYLCVVKLGNNKLSGTIPNSIGHLPELEYFSLHNNKFSGEIPSSIYNCTRLMKIDLSNNNLDGNLPTLMGTSLFDLRFLILHSNRLSGKISPTICHLQSLQILDLSHNQFVGIIPRCVSNFTAMATKRELGSIVFGKGDHKYDSISVVTKGIELEYTTTLSLVTVIDLSSNNLSGDIPNELTGLVELKSLNLSGNHLKGPIPDRIGDMKQLESLDFSRNSLSGQIPKCLALINYLSYLNLSFNKLRGRIPEGPQLQIFEASSFIGNDLCGPPLNNCSHGVHPQKQKQEEEEGVESEIKWLYVILCLGFAVGFSATCSALVLKKTWRDAYFGLLECAWDNIYVYLYIKWSRLTRSAVCKVWH